MSEALARLRRIHACAAAGDPINGPDAAWVLACAADAVLHAAEGRTFDAAFGATVPKGGRPWWQVLAQERRDEALRTLADLVAPGVPVNRQAAELQREVLRYRRTKAPADLRAFGGGKPMPARYEGTSDALLWTAFTEGSAICGEFGRRSEVPTSVDQLGRIIDPKCPSHCENKTKVPQSLAVPMRIRRA